MSEREDALLTENITDPLEWQSHFSILLPQEYGNVKNLSQECDWDATGDTCVPHRVSLCCILALADSSFLLTQPPLDRADSPDAPRVSSGSTSQHWPSPAHYGCLGSEPADGNAHPVSIFL